MPRKKRANKKPLQKKQQKTQENKEPQTKQETVEQKLPQAKKYKKKSHEEQERIERSKRQRIFLISAIRHDQDWRFTVQGTKGSQYHVIVSTEVKCTCMDFRLHKIPCKHIYFIVTQVGQNEELLDYFKNDRKISKKAYNILDKQLESRLRARLSKNQTQQKVIDLKDQINCVICFSEMQKQTELLEDCNKCHKYFHTQCLTAWKAHNPTCPLCRNPFKSQDNDPLGKVVQIDL